MRVGKTFRFSAAHQLTRVPEDHKCARLHGHNYRVEVWCDGPVSPAGMVRDFAEIRHAVRPLIDRLDHHEIHRVWLQEGLPWCHAETTAENLCAWILHHTPEWVTGVRVWETDDCWAEASR